MALRRLRAGSRCWVAIEHLTNCGAFVIVHRLQSWAGGDVIDAPLSAHYGINGGYYYAKVSFKF